MTNGTDINNNETSYCHIYNKFCERHPIVGDRGTDNGRIVQSKIIHAVSRLDTDAPYVVSGLFLHEQPPYNSRLLPPKTIAKVSLPF